MFETEHAPTALSHRPNTCDIMATALLHRPNTNSTGTSNSTTLRLPSHPALAPLLPSPAKLAALALLLRRSILMQKENGPVLTPQMRLIGQHQLRKHVLVAAHRTRILMLHYTSPVDIE